MVYIEESSHWYGKIGFYSDRSNLEVVGNGEILKIKDGSQVITMHLYQFRNPLTKNFLAVASYHTHVSCLILELRACES